MASAVFEDHPLQSYLQEIGEENTLPGGLGDISLELEDTCTPTIADDSWLPTFLDKIYHALEQFYTAESSQTFVERFKYTVISSSLLSTSLPPTTATFKRPHTPLPPGANHSRRPSSEINETSDGVSHLYWPSVAVLVIFGLGYHQLAVLALSAIVFYYFQSDGSSPDMSLCLDTLQDLITANDMWESIVQEAANALEKDEKCIYRDPSSPSSPSSILRVALHSSLLTTQTQSDNVRQLFSALTAPNEIAQISEMYAPASPPTSTIALPDPRTPESGRPFSLPVTQRRSMAPSDKRSTWNGPYAALGHGSPTSQLLRQRQNRRKSSLSNLMGSTSAPVSPALLAEVQEEGVTIPSFGAAALELGRRRRSMASLRRQPSLSAMTPMTLSSASRFTSLQTSRHLLSASSIQHVLQSSLAAKRYACSHLLALRFNEEFDEGYWEDVQSVISLLTSTLVDASTRLEEALEETEQLKLAEEAPLPSPVPNPKHNRRRSLSFGDESTSGTVFSLVSDERGLSARWNLGTDDGSSTSFAPMPSHLARFAAHVDAISSALVDARINLDSCVKSLRESAQTGLDLSEEDALIAYEALRKDLGLALRECERGRDRLLDVVHPPSPPPESDLPYLGADIGSEESDPRSDDDGVQPHPEGPTLLAYEADDDGDDESDIPSELIPPMGAEQVFEADVGNEPAPFTRERSKLSREERIRLAKEKRATIPQPHKPAMEVWGPGGDVVQELKDVIYQVGKRRRTMQAPPSSYPEPEEDVDIGIAL